MERPRIERHGDSFLILWDGYGIGFGLDRLEDLRDGLKAELTVEGTAPDASGRLLGPVSVNLLSNTTQTSLAKTMAERVNGLPAAVWRSMVIQACAIVSAQWRTPQPTLELDKMPSKGPVRYLIDLLLPEGETSIFFGDGESLKSMLALRLAYSVQQGYALPWGGMPTRQCNVLYLDWETNPDTVATRLRRLSLAEGDGSMPNVLYRQCFRPLKDELPSVREEISKRNVGLVIIDSIGFAADGSLLDDQVARATVRYLRLMSPATRLAIGHVSKETAVQTKGSGSPFGSRFFWNGMRSGVELIRSQDGTRDEDEISLGLYHRKTNDTKHHRPVGMRVLFEGDMGPIAFDVENIHDVPELEARTSIASRLYEALRGGSVDTKTLASELDENEKSILKTLKRMQRVVLISPGARGRPAVWGLAEHN